VPYETAAAWVGVTRRGDSAGAMRRGGCDAVGRCDAAVRGDSAGVTRRSGVTVRAGVAVAAGARAGPLSAAPTCDV